MIAGFCALAVAELVAAVVRPEAGPVAAVGGAVIDRTPPALKDFAVRNFGTNDKLVLQLGILALLAVFAMAVGVLALHRRLLGSAAVLVFGVVGAVAAIGRPEGRVSDALPSVVGAVVAAGVLYLLAGRLSPAPGPSPAAGGRDAEPGHGTFDRRRFVIAASAAAAASAGAGLLGRRLTSAVQAGAAASRRDLVLPVPGSAAAGVRPPSRGGTADQIVARSVDGMTIGTPVEDVMDGRDAMLALGMNGEPLPFEHGFPVRMVVPGLYGYVSACKWLKDIELTTFDDYDAYWVKRSWSRQAPIKTESRIDTPRPFASPKAGTIPVAGVAWAQHRGIQRVEVRVDGGPWNTARLAAEDSRDTWRQWVWEWPATSGNHTLEVRATDRTGATQTEERVGTVPNGATGWHSVVVDVS
ncbi:molybdopterin-dependent oxidoreductase [Streptomyces poriferorum]|uniref:molybdopterin-dependent oxidoreductase n=1 Tax=Streptomyces poriferorum TaxID=2798799 RepID=UPI0035593488